MSSVTDAPASPAGRVRDPSAGPAGASLVVLVMNR